MPPYYTLTSSVSVLLWYNTFNAEITSYPFLYNQYQGTLVEGMMALRNIKFQKGGEGEDGRIFCLLLFVLLVPSRCFPVRYFCIHWTELRDSWQEDLYPFL